MLTFEVRDVTYLKMSSRLYISKRERINDVQPTISFSSIFFQSKWINKNKASLTARGENPAESTKFGVYFMVTVSLFYNKRRLVLLLQEKLAKQSN